MNKILSCIILILGLSFSIFSQNTSPKDTLYLDENNLKISQIAFNKKCNAAIFNCRIEKNDSIVIQKVYYNFYFGKISTDEYKKVTQHFNKIIEHQIKESQQILIYHRDKLYSFDEGSKIDSIHNYENKKDYQKYKTKFLERTDKWNKSRAQLSNKVRRNYNTSTLFVANKNFGYELNNEYFSWIIDDFSFLKNTYYQSKIIIKPNGEYFISYGQIVDKNLIKILKSKDWSNFYIDFKKSVKTNYTKGYGIIEDLVIKEKRFIIE